MWKQVCALSLAVFALAGCAIFGGANDKALRRTPSFRAGYSDGCAAATAQSANPRDDKGDLAGEDRTYRRGYAMGFQSCRQTSTAPVGAPTGGLPNPGHP